MHHEPTAADIEIRECLTGKLSFAVIAGAGSGKTTSLVAALEYVRSEYGRELRRDGQKAVCITYTKRARDVLRHRLHEDEIFEISTIHSFLWGEVVRYTQDIADVIVENIIPMRIEKLNENTSGNSQRARKAREQISVLEEVLPHVKKVNQFQYEDGRFSNFREGAIGHDDVIDIAATLILTRPLLRKIIGQKYPFNFVDEAQDTFPVVVEALNMVCSVEGLPIVGYFGDPMQQIYDKRAGQFEGPTGYRSIPKEENYRSAKSVINIANKLRTDLQQVPSGPNSQLEGLVTLTLVESERPEATYRRYTDDQLDRALKKFDGVLDEISWHDHSSSKRLYLARQMIARRVGFLELHRLFDGDYASQRAKDEFEDGNHFLVKPIVEILWPIVRANDTNDEVDLLRVLRLHSPKFGASGESSERTVKEMLVRAQTKADALTDIWKNGSIREVLTYACKEGLCSASERLIQHLDRDKRSEDYDKDVHAAEKSDWLTDIFLDSATDELPAYCEFVTDNTPFSTQHGVKGEEYDDVLVLFDDVEAGWNNYSFSKLFVPGVAGEARQTQIDRTLRLAYVCFTRARKTLRVILFCPSPCQAKEELVARGWFLEDQISIF